MTKDKAEALRAKLHRSIYKGKSPDPTAADNQNRMFQSGYVASRDWEGAGDIGDLIALEWAFWGSSATKEDWDEFKRGVWAFAIIPPSVIDQP